MSAGTERRALIDRALEHRNIDIDSDLSRYQLKELIRVVEMMGGRISYDATDTDTAAVAATLDTDSAQGANAAIIFSAGAAAPGVMGNNLKVAYANTATAGSETVAWAVTKAGIITCTIGIETAVSTATQVLAALATDAGTLLTGALKTGNDGTGAVVTAAAAALAGGVDPVDQPGQFVITPAA